MRHGGRVPETQGDMSIRGLWESQPEAIVDIRFVDVDAETWKPVIMEMFLVG